MMGRPLKECPEGLVGELDKLTEAQAAIIAGVSIVTVRRWRRDQGVPLGTRIHTAKIDLEVKYPGIVEKLATRNNASVARDYDISRERVRQIRVHYDIEPCAHPWKRASDDPAFVRALGTESDRRVGARFKCSPVTVGKVRRELGIPVYSDPDCAASKIIAVKNRLGTQSDNSLATEIGVAQSQLSHVRARLGIQPWQLAKPKAPCMDPEWLKKRFHAGKTDQEMADEWGCHFATVSRWRYLLRLLRRPGKKS